MNTKPNFIIILADDMGYGDSSSYGGWISTPNLERLAAEGMRFTDFHSSGTLCSPTRAGLLTGRYQQRAGIPGVINADPAHPVHDTGLASSEVTFPKLLKKADYTTAVFGKWHLGYKKKYNPVHHGFDQFRGYVAGNIDYISHYDRMGTYDWWDNLEQIEEQGYSTHLITKHSVKFIRENADGPFCLFVSHEAVHTPFQAPGDAPQRGPKSRPDASSREQKRKCYRRMMVEMDRGIGEILDAVEESGIEENTLVFFFSDNGAAPFPGSNAPFRGHKGTVWEGGHREPAIARWPGRISPGAVTDQLAISLDLMPTMIELAGAQIPEDHSLDGISLTGLLLEEVPLRERQLFWNGEAMREGNWKLVIGNGGSREIGLYDLETDTAEENNLAEAHPRRVAAMLEAIDEWKRDVAEN